MFRLYSSNNLSAAASVLFVVAMLPVPSTSGAQQTASQTPPSAPTQQAVSAAPVVPASPPHISPSSLGSSNTVTSNSRLLLLEEKLERLDLRADEYLKHENDVLLTWFSVFGVVFAALSIGVVIVTGYSSYTLRRAAKEHGNVINNALNDKAVELQGEIESRLFLAHRNFAFKQSRIEQIRWFLWRRNQEKMSSEQPDLKAEKMLFELLQKDAKYIQLLQQLNTPDPSLIHNSLGFFLKEIRLIQRSHPAFRDILCQMHHAGQLDNSEVRKIAMSILQEHHGMVSFEECTSTRQ